MRFRAKEFIYFFVIVVIVLAMIGSYFALLRDKARFVRLVGEAPAKIEDVDVRRAVSPIDGSEYSVDVNVRYVYQIEGREYSGAIRMSKLRADDFVPWDGAKVCYDPKDPKTIENAELFPKNSPCGQY